RRRRSVLVGWIATGLLGGRGIGCHGRVRTLVGPILGRLLSRLLGIAVGLGVVRAVGRGVGRGLQRRIGRRGRSRRAVDRRRAAIDRGRLVGAAPASRAHDRHDQRYCDEQRQAGQWSFLCAVHSERRRTQLVG